MTEFLDVAGYTLVALTVLVLSVTLAAPLVRQHMLVRRLRRDLKTIDHMVLAWSRERHEY